MLNLFLAGDNMLPMFELLAKEKPDLYKRLSQEQYLPFFKSMQNICGGCFSDRSADMTSSEMSLCYCVKLHSQKNDGALPTVAETAAKLNVSVPAISRTLKNLEAKEYIRRVADKSDRRIVHILLTEKGDTLLLENFRVVSEVMDRALAQFSDEELRLMLELHVKFTTAVSQAASEMNQTKQH